MTAELRPTILLVEDEPEIRLFVRTALGAEGYRVVETENGERGVIDLIARALAVRREADQAGIDQYFQVL